jgi:hypothetical protein
LTELVNKLPIPFFLLYHFVDTVVADGNNTFWIEDGFSGSESLYAEGTAAMYAVLQHKLLFSLYVRC